MRIAVFGATGGIGRQVVEQALGAGHEVRALVRDESRAVEREGVSAVVGDIVHADAVARVIDGTDGVIWAVGATRNSADQVEIFERGARNVVAAMNRHGVGRLVALSGAGITIEGEQKSLGGRLMSAFVAVAVKHVVEAKRREYEVFSGSDLDWTLVRPPRVIEGPRTGRYVAGERLIGRSVTQADLAEFMLKELVERDWVRSAPFIGTT
jgi:putative NADH-flavin reductase